MSLEIWRSLNINALYFYYYKPHKMARIKYLIGETLIPAILLVTCKKL